MFRLLCYDCSALLLASVCRESEDHLSFIYLLFLGFENYFKIGLYIKTIKCHIKLYLMIATWTVF